jgi:hypothetical protein
MDTQQIIKRLSEQALAAHDDTSSRFACPGVICEINGLQVKIITDRSAELASEIVGKFINVFAGNDLFTSERFVFEFEINRKAIV